MDKLKELTERVKFEDKMGGPNQYVENKDMRAQRKRRPSRRA